MAVTAALLLPTAPAFAQAAPHNAPQNAPQNALRDAAKTASPAASSAYAPAPATVAKRLFDAWLRRDRAAAHRVATPASVRALFSYPFRAPDEFAGCVGGACRFKHTSVRVPGGHNGILMIVSGGKVVQVYRSRHFTKPSQAAAHLFAAYRAGDRNRALEAASAAAVRTLFRVKYDPRGAVYTYQGCLAEKGKGYSCAYSYEGGAMFMRVRGSAASGFHVASIGYIAD